MAKCFSGVVNEMQGGGWEAGGVLKTTWNGERAFGTGGLTVITREQREKRRSLAAGRGARGWGLRKAILITLCKKVKNSFCEIVFCCLVHSQSFCLSTVD